jgi:hypothetical protein
MRWLLAFRVSVLCFAGSAYAQTYTSAAEMEAARAEVLRVCKSAENHPDLAPLIGKMLTGGIAPTLEQFANPNKPTEEEKNALLAWGREGAQCETIADRFLVRGLPPGGESLVAERRMKIKLLQVRLYEGRISYGDYLKSNEEVRQENRRAADLLIREYKAEIGGREAARAQADAQREAARAQADAQRLREAELLMRYGAGLMGAGRAPNPTITTDCYRWGASVSCTSR